MRPSKETGELGEQLACDYLAQHGYSVLERNWTWQRAEIDIICRLNDVLVFVEVKTRKNAAFGEPAEFLSAAQQKRLIDAAQAYLFEKQLDIEIRFDVIEILLEQKPPALRHSEDAFFPTWE